MLTDQAILRHIERQPHQSAGYKQLVRELNLRGEDRRLLAERLEALVKSARLIETGATATRWPNMLLRGRT